MTKQEHALMMSMFGVQMQLIKTLANILKSNEIATDDDLRAFGVLTAETETAEVREAVVAVYRNTAQVMGVLIPE